MFLYHKRLIDISILHTLCNQQKIDRYIHITYPMQSTHEVKENIYSQSLY